MTQNNEKRPGLGILPVERLAGWLVGCEQWFVFARGGN
jgi:hypothetical protein